MWFDTIVSWPCARAECLTVLSFVWLKDNTQLTTWLDTLFTVRIFFSLGPLLFADMKATLFSRRSCRDRSHEDGTFWRLSALCVSGETHFIH